MSAGKWSGGCTREQCPAQPCEGKAVLHCPSRRWQRSQQAETTLPTAFMARSPAWPTTQALPSSQQRPAPSGALRRRQHRQGRGAACLEVMELRVQRLARDGKGPDEVAQGTLPAAPRGHDAAYKTYFSQLGFLKIIE